MIKIKEFLEDLWWRVKFEFKIFIIYFPKDFKKFMQKMRIKRRLRKWQHLKSNQ